MWAFVLQINHDGDTERWFRSDLHDVTMCFDENWMFSGRGSDNISVFRTFIALTHDDLKRKFQKPISAEKIEEQNLQLPILDHY